MPAESPAVLSVREIRRLDDPLLLPWLALYETAFPPEERDLVADLLAAVARPAPDEQGEHMLAAVEEGGRLAGLAFYNLHTGEHGRAAELFYLATQPALRNQGYGAWLYREVRRRVRSAGAQVLFLEVEIPERAGEAEQRRLAGRRIAFYRRLGCRRLAGVDYLQYVGDHVAPIPMYVLVDAPDGLPAEQVFSLAEQSFGRWLTRAGRVALE